MHRHVQTLWCLCACVWAREIHPHVQFRNCSSGLSPRFVQRDLSFTRSQWWLIQKWWGITTNGGTNFTSSQCWGGSSVSITTQWIQVRCCSPAPHLRRPPTSMWAPSVKETCWNPAMFSERHGSSCWNFLSDDPRTFHTWHYLGAAMRMRMCHHEQLVNYTIQMKLSVDKDISCDLSRDLRPNAVGYSYGIFI